MNYFALLPTFCYLNMKYAMTNIVKWTKLTVRQNYTYPLIFLVGTFATQIYIGIKS